MENKNWDKSYREQLQSLRALSSAAGGEKRIQKQHQTGKLTAIERINILFDPNTFQELNNFLHSRITDFGIDDKATYGDGVITGYGKINGRLAFASAQDFTVIGGSLGEYHAKKITDTITRAIEMGAPFIQLNDSGGARIEEGMDGLSGYSSIFLKNTQASGVIPQISAILGPCAGGACYSPAICDFVLMTEQTSQMYITGPAVVKTVIGETVTPNELGGAQVHMKKSGVAHFAYPDDPTCIAGIRQLLDYLPQNYRENVPLRPAKRSERKKTLEQIIPDEKSQPYDIREVIGFLADDHSFLEIQQDFAPNLVIGFARLNGGTIGIIANQPAFMAGALDYHASDKAARFIRFCDCFNIPILTLVDVPAFLPGKEQEHNGIIRHGAKLLYAYAEASVPKISLILRKAYGGAYLAMNSKNIGADLVFALPIAEMAVMGAEGAVNIIFRHEIESADDPEAARADYIHQYQMRFLSPYPAAMRGFVDEVILPEEAYAKISAGFAMLREKQRPIVQRHHGNIPL